VVDARNGVRLVAYGQGRSDRLQLPNIPMSGDVKVGDAMVTSGLGGRFPAGFPVGTIVALRPDESRAFLVGDLRPAAQLDRGRDVLLLRKDAALSAMAAPTAPVASTVDTPSHATAPTRPAPARASTPNAPATPAGSTSSPAASTTTPTQP
jgi:rod shape-determining protein MreC